MDLTVEEIALSAIAFSFIAGIGATILGVSVAVVGDLLVFSVGAAVVSFFVKKLRG